MPPVWAGLCPYKKLIYNAYFMEKSLHNRSDGYLDD
jgi:hypothetical protein